MREPDYESITPRELKEKLDSGESPLLLDVRQQWEFALARIEGSTLAPPDELPDTLATLDWKQETVVVCHHGVRSAHVTRILQQSGFEYVFNLEGGLDAYSEVDGSVSRY